ncbi:MAG: FAD-dependent oxidoreductase [Eubacterium sp.]|nr:FAD-dependent oxidoreductase [Eubacterium sp.]
MYQKGDVLLSRLTFETQSRSDTFIQSLYGDIGRRVAASPSDVCPVDLTYSLLKMAQTQTCGKCTPCRIGLEQVAGLLEKIKAHKATMADLDQIIRQSNQIMETADCALGKTAARMVLSGIETFRADYEAHIKEHHCTTNPQRTIPCVAGCPAHVDIPGYISCVKEGSYADAVRIIRKDNPFPVACALICEHPCEHQCRRAYIDAPVNIRGIKRTAVEKAGKVDAPKCAESTGKKVAVIGGGPSGLTCAYFLQLMGHQVTVFERRKRLGGMLVYGIPDYRLPADMIQQDIDCILSTGVEAKLESNIGNTPEEIKKLIGEYDAVYVAIGAHQGKSVRIDGEDANGVLSAVEYLGKIGDGEIPDFTGKKVAVIGGGNVAMDCTRSAIRCGADEVKIVYRRRKEDMTALVEEVDGAIAEGAIMMDLHAPLRIEKDANGNVASLIAEPQMPSVVKGGRVSPAPAGKDEVKIDCDIVLVAVGQGIEWETFDAAGVTAQAGRFVTEPWAEVAALDGVFAGGDCVSGPKTAILAISAGKVAARNIDNYLGFDHKIKLDVEIPAPKYADRVQCGRVNMAEREPLTRNHDFDLMEMPMSDLEAAQETNRCLRCDHYGCGMFKGGRELEW